MQLMKLLVMTKTTSNEPFNKRTRVPDAATRLYNVLKEITTS